MRSRHELWEKVQRSLRGEALGRTVAGLVLMEVDRMMAGSSPLWTESEIEGLKRPIVRDSRARHTYIRTIIEGCKARDIEPPPLDELDPPTETDIRIKIRWYLIERLTSYERGQVEILPPSNEAEAWTDYSESWLPAQAAAGHPSTSLPKPAFLEWYPKEFDTLKAHIAAAPRYRQYRQQESAETD